MRLPFVAALLTACVATPLPTPTVSPSAATSTGAVATASPSAAPSPSAPAAAPWEFRIEPAAPVAFDPIRLSARWQGPDADEPMDLIVTGECVRFCWETRPLETPVSRLPFQTERATSFALTPGDWVLRPLGVTLEIRARIVTRANAVERVRTLRQGEPDRIERTDVKRTTLAHMAAAAGSTLEPQYDKVVVAVLLSGAIDCPSPGGGPYGYAVYTLDESTGQSDYMCGAYGGAPVTPESWHAIPDIGEPSTECETTSGTLGSELRLCPRSARVGELVTIDGRGCANEIGQRPTLVFYTASYVGVQTGTLGGHTLRRVPVEPDGRFRLTFRVPAELGSVQGHGGGPTAPGAYAVVSKPPLCVAPFAVLKG